MTIKDLFSKAYDNTSKVLSHSYKKINSLFSSLTSGVNSYSHNVVVCIMLLSITANPLSYVATCVLTAYTLFNFINGLNLVTKLGFDIIKSKFNKKEEDNNSKVDGKNIPFTNISPAYPIREDFSTTYTTSSRLNQEAGQAR